MDVSPEDARLKRARPFDRVVDIASVALISLAAVLSAVCGYQSGRWSGQQTRLYSLASSEHIAAAEAGTKAIALTAIDVGMFLQYVDAVDARDLRKQAFLYQRFRPEMHSAMRTWLATKPLTNPHAPSSPFALPEYTARSHALEGRLSASAISYFDAAQIATEHADAYLLLTVTFAGVSFLAGMSTKMTFPRHVIVIAVGCLVLIYGLVRLSVLPFR